MGSYALTPYRYSRRGVMEWESGTYERDALAALKGASTSEEVESVSISYLGRKSELKQALREVRDRETGIQLNAMREAIESAVSAKKQEAEAAELAHKLAEEQADGTLPAELLRPALLRRAVTR